MFFIFSFSNDFILETPIRLDLAQIDKIKEI